MQLFDIEDSQNTFRGSHSVTSSHFQLEDVYNLNGVIPPLAPYSGSFDGPGALIPREPSEQHISSSSITNSSLFANEVDRRIEVDSYMLSLGADLEVRLNQRLLLTAASGLALRLVNIDASYTERLHELRPSNNRKFVQEWRDNDSTTDVLPGFYLQGGMELELTESVSVGGFLRYDWSDDVTGEVGATRYAVDFDSVSGGVYVGFEF